MDYTGILKRAWDATWKYKVLWLFGLFAGGMGGGFSTGNSNWNTGRSSSGTGQGTSGFPFGSQQQFADTMQRSLPLIIAVMVLFTVFALAWWVISIAAKGGIIHLVNEAEEGRPVRAGDGWRVGFSKWGRVFGIGFLAGLPVFILAAVMGVMIVLAVIGGVAGGVAGTSGSDALGPVLAALSGLCLVLAVLTIVLIVLSVIIVIVTALATRYAVLKDLGVVDSLRQGWSDLRAKRGAFLMYLIQWGVSIAYSIVVGVVALILIVPGVLIMFVGSWPVGLLMVVFAALILMVPAAAYGAFYQAVWTIFFRRMTGAEPVRAATLPTDSPGLGYPGSDAGFPPPPPAAGYAPPAPPAPSAGGYMPPDDPAAPTGEPPAGG